MRRARPRHEGVGRQLRGWKQPVGPVGHCVDGHLVLSPCSRSSRPISAAFGAARWLGGRLEALFARSHMETSTHGAVKPNEGIVLEDRYTQIGPCLAFLEFLTAG